MSQLHERVSRAIRRNALISRGARVLVAVSGGSDSVALLELLRLIAATGLPPAPFVVAGIAHLNHGLRGEDSDTDERFCRHLASTAGVVIEVGRADVRDLARQSGTSVEAAARTARHAFLRDAAARLRADRIALGHTMNDQAETYLLRLLRGAGPAGLAGMAWKRGPIIRPLLGTTRAELRDWLGARGLGFREDASNDDVSIPRNRVRHELLPVLADRFNPRVLRVLARNATLAGADEAWLGQQARRASGRVVADAPGGGRSLDAGRLLCLPPALAGRVVRRTLAEVAGSRFCGFSQVASVLEFAAASSAGGPQRDLPGVRMERIAGKVVLTSRGPRLAAAAAWRYALPVPGVVQVPEAALEVEAAEAPRRARPDAGVPAPDRDVAVIDAACAAAGLFVRARQPGDVLRPLGLGGRKKLQDVLVDRRVPRRDRDRIPLVVDNEDRIVWVGGHVVAEEARVTDRTQTVVILKLTRSSRSGEGA